MAAEDSESHRQIVQNRNEIVYLIDAQDANPNSNPLSPSNRARIDPVTGQVVVTDVRLKRYIRDQLFEDGHGIYVANVTDEDGNAPTREYLMQHVANVDGPADIDPSFLDTFLNRATDVRYFGATLAFETDDDKLAGALAKYLPQQLTGAAQINTGRSIHPVRENENYDNLTSVIATDEDKDQGGYLLDDQRIVYGLIGFSAVVNENTANSTHLTETDLKRLDTLCWRAVKNQANSRSKQGQHPRLYLRVEYEDSYHMGNLDRTLDLGDESAPAEKLTDVMGASVDISRLIERLRRPAEAGRITKLTLAYDPILTIESKGETISTRAALKSHLEDELDVDVDLVNVPAEYTETLPEDGATSD